MKKLCLIIFFSFFIAFFAPSVQAQDFIALGEIEGAGISIEEDCRVERISGQFAHRVGCFFVVPEMFVSYFIVSSVLGSVFVGGGYLLERKTGQPKRFKKAILGVLFVVPFVLLLFL